MSVEWDLKAPEQMSPGEKRELARKLRSQRHPYVDGDDSLVLFESILIEMKGGLR